MKTISFFQVFLLVTKGRVKRTGSWENSNRGAEQQHGVASDTTSTTAEPVRALMKTTTTTAAKTTQALAVVQRKKAYDHVLDWTPPSTKSVRRIQRQLIDPLKSATSSVFYSTDQHGKRHRGLSYVPPHNCEKPMLFVSNHQLLGVDSLLLVNEIHEQCQISLRPLTHPMLYPSDKTLDGSSFFETYGCLPVSTRNFYRLLQTSQPILLFPGGIQEAFMTSQTQAYSMTGWTKDRQDFVRAAAKFNATIVPLSGIGAAESALFWQDLPILRDLAPSAQNLLQRVMAESDMTVLNARYNSLAEERVVPFPLVVPKLAPSRHYFLFGQPVDLSNLDPNDRNACDAVYRDIKETIQQGCVDLSVASRRDLFQNPLLRAPHERMWRKQAPSFPLRLLNQ